MNIKNFLLAIALLLLSSERVKANNLLLQLNLKPLPDEVSAYGQSKERAIANPVLAQNSTEAEQLFNQGTEQYQNNQIEAAIETWQQALTLYRQQQDFSGESLTLGRMGLAYEALEDYSQAVDYFEQTLAVAKKIDSVRLEASILGNLGNNY